MKILFIVADSNPFSKQGGGGSQRTHLIAEGLAQCAQVDIAVFAHGAVSDIPNCNVIYSQYIDMWKHGNHGLVRRMKHLLNPLNPYSYYPIVEEAAAEMHRVIESRNYDYICVRYLDPVFTCGLLPYADRLIVDVDDYPSDEMLRNSHVASTWQDKIYYYLLSKIMKRSMNRVIGQCKHIFTPNTPQWSSPNTSILPNVPFYTQGKPNPIIRHDQPSILFVGGLTFPPNRDGVEHFLQRVYPRVIETIPNVQFNIVGACPDKNLKEKVEAYPNVHAKGYVNDLIQEYVDCDICVAPIYAGAGTNIKVIEALQMYRPCVITPTAYRGLDLLVNGEDIIVANDDDEFADAIIKLFRNPEQIASIAANGYEKYNAYFSKEYFFQVIQDALILLPK